MTEPNVQQLENIASTLGWQGIVHRPLTQDGSDRAYYRISDASGGTQHVLMCLGKEDQTRLATNNYDWIKIQRCLANRGFMVPEVLATLPEQGHLVTTDLGDQTLEQFTTTCGWPEVCEKYLEAIEIIRNFIQIPLDENQVWTSRRFDEEKFLFELNFFKDHFLIPLGLIKPASESTIFSTAIQSLAQEIAARSQYFVHRDYHSRNIMVAHNHLAIIDFQDARIGPASYDLVSLCCDPYVNLNINQRRHILGRGLSELYQVEPNINEEWQPVMLQRQLKALGSFGYLTLSAKRGNYLKYARSAAAILQNLLAGYDRYPFFTNQIVNRILASDSL